MGLPFLQDAVRVVLTVCPVTMQEAYTVGSRTEVAVMTL